MIYSKGLLTLYRPGPGGGPLWLLRLFFVLFSLSERAYVCLPACLHVRAWGAELLESVGFGDQ